MSYKVSTIMDKINIRHLEIYAHHGVFPKEKQEGQVFYLDAELYLSLHEAGQTDDLTKTVHYGEVCELMKETFTERSFDLIERAAEVVVQKVLLAYPLVRKMTLTVNKPHAPIPIPFENVSVQIERGWKRAYLGIGSNLGDKRKYIEDAVGKLKKNELIREVRCSKLLVTKPYGGVEQDDFLNGAIEIETLLSPMELLTFLQQLEQEAHRERKVHWGPRTLDLDILFYDNEIIDTVELHVPHIDMENRDFVLKPMVEIAPYLRHPVLNLTMEQLLKKLEGKTLAV